MIKKWCFFLILLCSISTNAFAQPAESAKDSVKVGIYITNLYDFNLADGSFVAEFWTWSLHNNDNLSFKDTQEVIKAKKTVCTNFATQKKPISIGHKKSASPPFYKIGTFAIFRLIRKTGHQP